VNIDIYFIFEYGKYLFCPTCTFVKDVYVTLYCMRIAIVCLTVVMYINTL